MDDFYRIKRLPPYVLAAVTDLKVKARVRGEDIYGEDHVRFALVENEHRIRQAVRGIRAVLG